MTANSALFATLLAAAAAVAHAQLVGSFTASKSVTVSSNPVNTANIVDGNDNTQWQSGACFDTDYLNRADMNPLLFACATTGRCKGSEGATSLAAATDQSVYTGAGVPLPKGAAAGTPAAFVQADLPAAATVLRGSVKAFGGAPIDVMLIASDGTAVKAATLNAPTDNYKWAHGDGSWNDIVSVRVQSTAGFTLTEFGVQTGNCYQWATVDMGAVNQVGMIRVRVWSPNATATALLFSEDGSSWTKARDLNPGVLDVIPVWLPSLTPMRYIMVNHTILNKGPWAKVYVWGIDAFDKVNVRDRKSVV